MREGRMSDKVRLGGRLGVTRRQNAVLEFVAKYCAEHGHSPSYQEIADAVGIASKSGVKRLIDGLVERGRLEMLPRRARSMVVA